MTKRLNPGLTRGAAYGLVIAYLSALLIGVGCIVYTNITVQENNRKWCDVLSPLDSAYRSAPVNSPVAKKVRTAIHNRVVDFKC